MHGLQQHSERRNEQPTNDSLGLALELRRRPFVERLAVLREARRRVAVEHQVWASRERRTRFWREWVQCRAQGVR